MNAKNSLSNLQAVEIPQDTAVNLANGRYGTHNAIEPVYPAISDEEFNKTMSSYNRMLVKHKVRNASGSGNQ